MVNRISAAELHREINSGALENDTLILDVRTPAEFREAHISGSHNIELSQFIGSEEILTQNKKIIVICKGGVRAGKAYAKIPENILSNTYILDGGLDSWLANGFDVIKLHVTRFSVMQQVQIFIGLCVAIGSILTLITSKWFVLIPLFFGCGLTFAGLTGICMLLRLLSKMPWNR